MAPLANVACRFCGARLASTAAAPPGLPTMGSAAPAPAVPTADGSTDPTIGDATSSGQWRRPDGDDIRDRDIEAHDDEAQETQDAETEDVAHQASGEVEATEEPDTDGAPAPSPWSRPTGQDTGQPPPAPAATAPPAPPSEPTPEPLVAVAAVPAAPADPVVPPVVGPTVVAEPVLAVEPVAVPPVVAEPVLADTPTEPWRPPTSAGEASTVAPGDAGRPKRPGGTSPARTVLLVALLVAVVALAVVVVSRSGLSTIGKQGDALAGKGEWVTYTDPDGVFSVQLPVNPTVENTTTDFGTPWRRISAQAGASRFTVETIDFRSGVGGVYAERYLDEEPDAFARGLGGRLVYQNRTGLQGHPAVEFAVDAGDGYRWRATEALFGSRLYVFAVAARSDAPEGLERLVQSFQPLAPKR